MLISLQRLSRSSARATSAQPPTTLLRPPVLVRPLQLDWELLPPPPVLPLPVVVLDPASVPVTTAAVEVQVQVQLALIRAAAAVTQLKTRLLPLQPMLLQA